MWCHTCRQDVPGLASGLDRHFACARCGSVILLAATPAAAPSPNAAQPTADDSAPSDKPSGGSAAALLLDIWTLDQQLQHLHRVQGPRRTGSQNKQSSQAAAPGRELRSEAAHDAGVSRPHFSTEKHTRRKSGSRVHRRIDAAHPMPAAQPATQPAGRGVLGTVLSFASWLLLSAGLAAFTCGAVLSGWGLLEGRDRLWNVGLPILLASQAALLLGLLLQLDIFTGKRKPVETVETTPSQHGKRELNHRGTKARRRRERI